MSIRTVSRLVLTALLVLIPTMALALDMEFYVWIGPDGHMLRLEQHAYERLNIVVN